VTLRTLATIWAMQLRQQGLYNVTCVRGSEGGAARGGGERERFQGMEMRVDGVRRFKGLSNTVLFGWTRLGSTWLGSARHCLRLIGAPWPNFDVLHCLKQESDHL